MVQASPNVSVAIALNSSPQDVFLILLERAALYVRTISSCSYTLISSIIIEHALPTLSVATSFTVIREPPLISPLSNVVVTVKSLAKLSFAVAENKLAEILSVALIAVLFSLYVIVGVPYTFTLIVFVFTLPRWSVAVTRYVSVLPAEQVPFVNERETFSNSLPKLSFAMIPSDDNVIFSPSLKLVLSAFVIVGKA